MAFSDGDLTFVDYNTQKIILKILKEYGFESIDKDAKDKKYCYQNKKIKIEKTGDKLKIYARFNNDRDWHIIWSNYSDQVIHSDFIEYINSIPRIEESKNKEKKTRKDYIIVKADSIDLKRISKIIHYLGDYEDEFLKIIRHKVSIDQLDYLFLTTSCVMLKENNQIVYNESFDTKKQIDIYKPGKWQEHLENLYNVKKKVEKFYDNINFDDIDIDVYQKVKEK